MRRLMAVLVLGSVVAACAAEQADEAADVEAAAEAGIDEQPVETLTDEQVAAVTSVRETAGGWSDIETARAAGYTNQFPAGCIETEEGSQGFHFLNDALLDGTTELQQPELLMYEPQADGSLELIGVDYVIPFDRWSAEQPPELLGRSFMRNEALGVWALHIWTHRDNPSGIFAMFNPDVSCADAAQARL